MTERVAEREKAVTPDKRKVIIKVRRGVVPNEDDGSFIVEGWRTPFKITPPDGMTRADLLNEQCAEFPTGYGTIEYLDRK